MDNKFKALLDLKEGRCSTIINLNSKMSISPVGKCLKPSNKYYPTSLEREINMKESPPHGPLKGSQHLKHVTGNAANKNLSEEKTIILDLKLIESEDDYLYSKDDIDISPKSIISKIQNEAESHLLESSFHDDANSLQSSNCKELNPSILTSKIKIEYSWPGSMEVEENVDGQTINRNKKQKTGLLVRLRQEKQQFSGFNSKTSSESTSSKDDNKKIQKYIYKSKKKSKNFSATEQIPRTIDFKLKRVCGLTNIPRNYSTHGFQKVEKNYSDICKQDFSIPTMIFTSSSLKCDMTFLKTRALERKESKIDITIGKFNSNADVPSDSSNYFSSQKKIVSPDHEIDSNLDLKSLVIENSANFYHLIKHAIRIGPKKRKSLIERVCKLETILEDQVFEPVIKRVVELDPPVNENKKPVRRKFEIVVIDA